MDVADRPEISRDALYLFPLQDYAGVLLVRLFCFSALRYKDATGRPKISRHPLHLFPLQDNADVLLILLCSSALRYEDVTGRPEISRDSLYLFPLQADAALLLFCVTLQGCDWPSKDQPGCTLSVSPAGLSRCIIGTALLLFCVTYKDVTGRPKK
jgi:hypothetical protein